MAMAVLPKTRTLSDSAATCFSFEVGAFDAGQELGLGFERTVVLNEHKRIVEIGSQGLSVSGLVSLVPGLFGGGNLGASRGFGLILHGQRKCAGEDKEKDRRLIS